MRRLGIRDLGVIAEATLPLGAGFTAVTGETGAGKTMVVTALGLLLGARADAGAVRAGRAAGVASRAAGSCRRRRRSPSASREAGGDVDPSAATLSCLGRSVSRRGPQPRRRSAAAAPRSACSASSASSSSSCTASPTRCGCARRPRSARRSTGSPAPSSRRCSPSTGRRSRAGGPTQRELDALVAERDAPRARGRGPARRDRRDRGGRTRSRGEDAELAERAERLTQPRRPAARRGAGARARSRPSSRRRRPTPSALVEAARRQPRRVAGHDAALAPIAEALADASASASPSSPPSSSSYLAGLDADGARELEIVQERRAALGALVRKYGPTLDDVLDFLETGSARLLELDNDADRIDDARRRSVDADARRVDELAAPPQRPAHATRPTRLGGAVTAELARARDARRAPRRRGRRDAPSSTPHGRDQVAILLQPHPGAEPRPLGAGRIGRRALAGDARDRGRHRRDRPGADLRLRRGRRRGRRCRGDRDRPAARPARRDRRR